MALIDKLSAIGDAIRAKTGKTEKLSLDQMVTEINGIETGGGALMLYAGGNEYTTLTGGWSAVNGTLNKQPTYMQYYSSASGTIQYAATAKAIDFKGKKKLHVRGRKDNSGGTASNYTVGLSTGRGSGIVAQYNVGYAASTYKDIEVDLSALDLTTPYYVFLKSGGTSTHAMYIATVYAE